ncbi:MAG TPA: signal peptide peptidase SppA, partial [Phenylobacterium sp.]|nr:signal peptide peptidase SppA [Phenylobacterium sp.]
KGGDAIALIEAEGPIMTGKDQGSNPFTGGKTIYSDDLADAILRAAKSNSIKAIVLRVNSPGGSDTASEQILDAIRYAKAKGKPVVVSMSTYAASGGYWISSEASAIVAQPTTLTGSIGVFGGKFAVGPALAKFGVDVRDTGVGGQYAGAFGMGQPFTPAQRAAFAGWMDRIYGEFITRVAAGRKLPPERVREIAKGRVWTGVQAKGLGLVDEVGGFYQAVDKARQLAKLDQNTPLRRMTPTEGAFEALQNALGISATSARTLAAAAWVFGDPRAQSIIDRVAEAKLRSDGGGTVLAPMPIPR